MKGHGMTYRGTDEQLVNALTHISLTSRHGKTVASVCEEAAIRMERKNAALQAADNLQRVAHAAWIRMPQTELAVELMNAIDAYLKEVQP